MDDLLPFHTADRSPQRIGFVPWKKDQHFVLPFFQLLFLKIVLNKLDERFKSSQFIRTRLHWNSFRGLEDCFNNTRFILVYLKFSGSSHIMWADNYIYTFLFNLLCSNSRSVAIQSENWSFFRNIKLFSL